MARKTIKIQDLKDKINGYLRKSADNLKSERRGMAVVLSGVLHDTGNYRGFCYLTPDQMKDEKGSTVGINAVAYDKDPTMEEKFDGTDDTRVEYF